MSKARQRLTVAAPTRQRIPHGALGVEAGIGISGPDLANVVAETTPPVNAPNAEARRAKPGRRPKDIESKAKGVTVTLFQREYEGLDRLVGLVHEHYGLPSNMLPRSQIARLAILRLMELSPEEIWEELKRLKP